MLYLNPLDVGIPKFDLNPLDVGIPKFVTISDDRIPGSPTLYNCAKHQFLELARLPAHWICVVEVFQTFRVGGSVVVACW